MRKVHIGAHSRPLAWQHETRLAVENCPRVNSSARWYDPDVGRWLSEDPIGFDAGDANLYRYVGNGVTNTADPSGMDPRFGPFPDPGPGGEPSRSTAEQASFCKFC